LLFTLRPGGRHIQYNKPVLRPNRCELSAAPAPSINSAPPLFRLAAQDARRKRRTSRVARLLKKGRRRRLSSFCPSRAPRVRRRAPGKYRGRRGRGRVGATSRSIAWRRALPRPSAKRTGRYGSICIPRLAAVQPGFTAARG
jgi:hypothetical protein